MLVVVFWIIAESTDFVCQFINVPTYIFYKTNFSEILNTVVQHAERLVGGGVVTRPLSKDGAWWKTMEPQKLSNPPRPGPEVVERQIVTKERTSGKSP